MSDSTSEKTCHFCSRVLIGKQEKFCSKPCSVYFYQKNFRKRHKNEKLEKTFYKFRLEPGDPTKVRNISGHLKPGKGKQFKLKKVSKLSGKKHQNKEHLDFKGSKSVTWRWYWDVTLKDEPLEGNMKHLYKHIDKLFMEERFNRRKHYNEDELYPPLSGKI